ncbi:MAG TPA: hypothetical protein VII03_03430 [Solirubrobacteraceae bacterium]
MLNRGKALILLAAVLGCLGTAVALRELFDTDPLGTRAVARAAVPHGCASPAAEALARRRLRSGIARYRIESGGSVIHTDLQQIAHDAALTGALRAGDMRAALAAANGELVRHVVQIRVLHGSHVLLDANPSSFDVAGSSIALRSRDGRALGRLQITVQDIIGFIKLERKIDHTRVLVRSSNGLLRTSLPGATALAMPDSGCVRVGRRTYVVSSFGERGYKGESLRIWLLTPAQPVA